MFRCICRASSFVTEDASRTFRAVLVGATALIALLLGSEPGLGQGIGESRTLPAEFRAHRIYVHPVTERGDTLELYTDTGGGRLPLIAESAVETYDLSIADTVRRAGRELPVVSFPEFPSEASIPPGPTGRFYVYPFGRRAKITGLQDGLLGSGWFEGRVWTFDYGKGALILHRDPGEIDWSPLHTVSIGFKSDSTGERANSFASGEARIDGTTHAFLFDTASRGPSGDRSSSTSGSLRTIPAVERCLKGSIEIDGGGASDRTPVQQLRRRLDDRDFRP